MVWCCVHRPSVIPLVDLKLLGNKMNFEVIVLERVHGKGNTCYRYPLQVKMCERKYLHLLQANLVLGSQQFGLVRTCNQAYSAIAGVCLGYSP